VDVILCCLPRALVLNRIENEYPKNFNREILKLFCSGFCKLYGTYIELSKATPATGRGGPQGCETSRFPHFLDNRLTDGGKVVSLTRRPPLTPPKYSWYSFLLEAESTPGATVRLEGLGQLKNPMT
jgi:hypothetical protein